MKISKNINYEPVAIQQKIVILDEWASATLVACEQHAWLCRPATNYHTYAEQNKSIEEKHS